MNAILAALGTFAALASFALSFSIWLYRLRKNEIAHLYARIDRLEREINEIKEGMADLRERVAKLEVMRYNTTRYDSTAKEDMRYDSTANR